MSPTIKKVALAGATGDIGAPVLKALLEANYEVTALTRQTSDHKFPDNVKVAKVDYNSVESLTSALQGQDALISTVAITAGDQQKCLVEAAVAAGVKRLIPSEFGSDPENAKARALPVFAPKVETKKQIEAKCAGTGTTYTFVSNNQFLDWGINSGFMIDVKGKKMNLYDGGNTRFTATPLAFVAEGTVAILSHLDQTANRVVRLHGIALTQNKFLEIAQNVAGKEGWEVTEFASEEKEQDAWKNLKANPENVWGWVPGFLNRSVYAEGFGGDLSERNDNEMLGLKEVSEAEVDEMMRGAV